MDLWLIILISFIVIAFTGLLVLSHGYYHRSLMATLAEFYLRITEKELSTDEVIEKLPDLGKINDVKISCPKWLKRKVGIVEQNNGAMQTFILKGNVSNAVIYLHGAGYVRNPRKEHWRFAYKINKTTGSTVLFVKYPKAPNHNYEEAYSLLTDLYLSILGKYNKISLMGDSSGGGLALGLAEDFIVKKIKQPDELILLSPWVDITLENSNIEKYEKIDPIVFPANDRIWGASWALGTDLKNYKVSPLYGNMLGLKKVSIFIGTREVLYPDVKILADILIDSKADVDVYVGKGLNHVYPIYPIPEAKTTLKIINKIIKR